MPVELKTTTTPDSNVLEECKRLLTTAETNLTNTLKQVIDEVNANETRNNEAWSTQFKEFKDRITEDMVGHSKTLDELRGHIENRMIELEKATPGRVEMEPQRLVVELISKGGPGDPEKKEISIHAQHQKFPDLVADMKVGHNVYNYGPTGSGKTIGVYTAAHVLGLKVYRKVMNRETSPYIFSGYMKGETYVKGMAFDPYTQGGVLFVDELDNGNANASTTLKEYADSDEVWFPHGLFKKHPDFRIVANANTIGNGANQTYVGRNQLDKALLNIFKFHLWDYDEAFEEAICWKEFLDCGGQGEQKPAFDKFLKNIRQFRRAVNELGVLHILSPRNFKQATKDYALGRPLPHILESIILKGLDEGQCTKIMEKVKSYNPKNERAKVVNDLWS